jgi:parvulin-like peptidyl-prolyl isomerase
MLKNLYKLFIFLIISVTLLACDKDSQTVARVGNETVSLEEFKEILSKKNPRKPISEISLEEKEKILTGYLEDRLRILNAKELGLDKDPKIVEAVNMRRKRILASKYPEILITDKLVTPEMIRAYKNLQEYNINLMVVALGYKGSNIFKSERSRDLTLALATQLYDRIREGDSTSAISAIYSDQASIKNSKGNYPKYQPLTFDPEADIHISKAGSGQLMKPFTTTGGIYIIEIIEKSKKEEEKKPVPDENQIKWQIYNKFYRQAGDTLYNQYSREFCDHFNTEISDEGIDKFLEAIESWSADSKKNDISFTDSQREIILATVGDITITSGYFIDEFQGTFTSNYLRFNDHDNLKKVLEDYVERFLVWIKKAEENRIDQLPEVKKSINDIMDTQLIEIFNRTQIQEFAKPTPEEIDKYYEINKENYKTPQKIQIWEIVVDDEKLAQEIYEQAKSSKTRFEDLAKKYSMSQSSKERGGALGYLTMNATRPFIKEAFDAGANQIISPIKGEDHYYIIKTGDILPEVIRSREQVEQAVRTGARVAKEDSIRSRIFEELKSKYKFWINEKLLKSMT